MSLNVISAANSWLQFLGTVEHQLPKATLCKAGCHGCCHQVVSCLFLEGFTIALEVLMHEDEGLLHRVGVAALAYRDPEMNIEDHFERGIPCVFLDDGKCSLYGVRPLVCRLHMVVRDVDPIGCWPKSLGGLGVAGVPSLDVRELHRLGVKAHAKLADKLGWVMAPIPLMVLYAAEIASRGTDRHDEVIQYLEGFPTMIEWCKAHAQHQAKLTATFDRGTDIHNETCLGCHKHISRHYGGTEYRCYPRH